MKVQQGLEMTTVIFKTFMISTQGKVFTSTEDYGFHDVLYFLAVLSNAVTKAFIYLKKNTFHNSQYW